MFRVSRLDRYILGAVFTPLIASMGIAIALLVLDQMQRLFQFVLNQNGEVGVVWRLLAWLIPEYVSLALPIGFMISIMFAVRRLALSSELRAMMMTGASLGRLMRPVFVVGAGLLTLNFLVVGYVQPLSAYQYSRLAFEVQSRALTAQVRPGIFVPVNDYTTLRIEGRNGAKVWRQVFLKICEKGENCRIITAQRGALVDEPSPKGELLLRLYDGRQAEIGADGPRDQILGFRQWDVPIQVGTPTAFRSRGGDRKEATFTEIVRRLFFTAKVDRDEHNALLASFHWRILHVLLMLMIPLAAAPLAMTDPRRDSPFGMVVGIGGIILYFKLMQAAEAEVARGAASPFLSMWPIAAAFAASGLILAGITTFKPGARPLAFIETPFERLVDFVRKRLARRRVRDAATEQVRFAPSRLIRHLRIRTLTIYLAKAFFVRFLFALAIMVGVLQILDLLSTADAILAAPGADQSSFWRYIFLKAPALINRFTPFAALLAALATLAELSHRGEINAIRSSGLSAMRVLAPLCVVGVAISLLHFSFGEWIGAPNAEKLGLWRDADFAPAALLRREAYRRDIWVADGPVIVNARSAARGPSDTIDFTGVMILERGEGGLAERLSTASRARLNQGVLAAQKVTQLTFEDASVLDLLRSWWQVVLPAERILGRALQPDEARLSELQEHLRVGETIGERAPVLATAFYHRFAAPLASAIMPFLAAVAGFGIARRGRFLLRLLIGAALGFAYFIAENAMVAMGNLGAAWPAFAAFFPLLLFVMIGWGTVLFLED